MNLRPALSIIIPWSNRPELQHTLRRNRAFLAVPSREVLVVNCGGEPELFRRLLRTRPFPGLRGVELTDTRFNKSLALNLGASVAQAPCLFFLDTDVVLRSDFLGEALRLLGRRHFVTVDRVTESQPPRGEQRSHLRELAYSVRLVDAQGHTAVVETNRRDLLDGSRGGPGMVLMRRKDFLAVGGMNADLSGWGWEDLDLLIRLQLQRGLKQRRHGAVLHLSHGDELRDLQGDSRAATEQLNMARSLANYQVGHYWGTYEDDVRTWSARCTLLTPEALRKKRASRSTGT